MVSISSTWIYPSRSLKSHSTVALSPSLKSRISLYELCPGTDEAFWLYHLGTVPFSIYTSQSMVILEYLYFLHDDYLSPRHISKKLSTWYKAYFDLDLEVTEQHLYFISAKQATNSSQIQGGEYKRAWILEGAHWGEDTHNLIFSMC